MLALVKDSLAVPPSNVAPEKMYYLVFLLMLGLGIYLFVKGFRVYWEFRVIQNIPVAAIRGLAMGLVRVRGRATGEESLISPFSNQPCYFYELHVEKWVTDHRNRYYWARWMRDSDSVRFYLQDETGKVLLHPRGAELELNRKYQAVIDGELPESIVSGSHRRVALKNPDDSSLARAPAGGQGGEPGTVPIAGFESVEERNQLELMGSLARVGSKPEVGRFRLTESLILPDVWYDVTGTCGENHLAKDQEDHNLIKKGSNEPTFVITDKEPGDVEKTLDLRAVAYIFGGAFLAVVSAALMLLLARTS